MATGNRRQKQNLEGLLRLAVENSAEGTVPQPQETVETDGRNLAFLQNALQSMTVNPADEIQVVLTHLKNESASIEDKKECLDVIREYIDDIDIANSVVKTGGILTILEFIRKPVKELRTPAIYVVAEMSQNNIFCQNYILNAKMLPILASTMNEADANLARGSIYAISSLIQNFPPALNEFRRMNGPKSLITCLSSKHVTVYVKAAFLIASLSTNDNSFRDLFNKENAVQVLLSQLEVKDDYDEKLEATLYALSALSLNSKWKIPADQKKQAEVILRQIISNKSLTDTCEEIIAYAQNTLKAFAK